MKTKKLLFLIGALLLVICGVVFLYLKTSVMSTEEAIQTLREYDRQHVVVDPESGKKIKIINKEILDHFKKYQAGKEEIIDYPYIDTIIERYTKKILAAREIDEAKSEADKTSQQNENESHHRLLIRCLEAFTAEGCTMWNFLKCCDNIRGIDAELMAFVCMKGIANKPHLINAKDKYGETPLMYAARYSTAEVCKALISAGADVNAKNNAGGTLLMRAAGNPSGETFKIFIAGADVNAKDKYGWTPLLCARTVEACKALIAAGADVNAKNKYGWTPLRCTRTVEACKELISAGADVNVKDEDGRTPLMCTETVEKCKVLISAGADVNAKDEKGKTPLMYAGTVEKCKVLISAGADVNAKDENGRTSLWHAAIESKADVCKALIEAGADVNAKDDAWRTPLNVAKTAEVRKVLIEAGATDQ